jgi:hypothetical protein
MLQEIKDKLFKKQSLPMKRALEFLKKGDEQTALVFAREELRWNPSNKTIAQLVKKLEKLDTRFENLDKYEPEFVWMVRQVAAHTMLSLDRLYALYINALAICNSDIEGDFFECGVAGGGSTLLLSLVLTLHDKKGRILRSFDTFSGMPKPSKEDKANGLGATEAGWGENSCSASADFVQKLLERYGANSKCLLVPGLFQESLPDYSQNATSISFLHMDGDWYASTMSILDNLYPKIARGGYVQIDDYGYWEGCRKAFHEYFDKHSLKSPDLTVIDETGCSFTVQ